MEDLWFGAYEDLDGLGSITKSSRPCRAGSHQECVLCVSLVLFLSLIPVPLPAYPLCRLSGNTENGSHGKGSPVPLPAYPLCRLLRRHRNVSHDKGIDRKIDEVSSTFSRLSLSPSFD